MDGPRRSGEEEQVTGLEVRRGHGLAGLRLVPRVAWKVDAMGAVDAVGEPGAVESVGGDAGPQVAQAIELLRGLHEVLAAGLLGLLSDVVDINVIGVDPGRSTAGEGDADIVDVLGDERQVDVEADVGTGVLGDRKSTRLNSSHVAISYAVLCLKKKKQIFKIMIQTFTQHLQH